jgi:hypothetical protein
MRESSLRHEIVAACSDNFSVDGRVRRVERKTKSITAAARMSDRNDRHAKANCFHNAGCAYQTRKTLSM